MALPAGALGASGTAAGSSMWGRANPAGEALELADLVLIPAWHAEAACRTAPARLSWFPERGDPVDAIRAVCESCPVVDECRVWALAQGPSLQGWWGGLSERQRRSLRKG